MKITIRLSSLLIYIGLCSICPFDLNAQVISKKQEDSLLAENKWKLSSFALKKLEEDKQAEQRFILTTSDLDELLHILKGVKEIEILRTDWPSNSVIIKTSSKIIKQKFLALNQVIFLDLVQQAKPEIGIIGYDRGFHGINAVDHLIPGANGKNIVAGVKEQKMEDRDLDLWKRVLPSSIASTVVTNHATVISTIIGGAGNSFYDGRGIAWGVQFFPSSFANLFPDDLAVLNANRVTVQNHSYGTVIQQFYGAEAVSYDAQTSANKNLLHVFSSGNQGTSFATDGKYANIPGFANLTGNFKMAKNIITVGAIDNKGMIPAESSAGPLYDGRLAPQLIALGPNGTSDAAAVVSGTVAVMQQVFADSNNQIIPPASLVKSILYNTAEDIYTPGPDYKTGYGLLDSYAAIRALQHKNYEGSVITSGQSWTRNIMVPANTAQLKVTLAWTDTTATVNNTKALLNDLDLEVTELNTGTVFQPWVLAATPRADSLAKPAFRKRDSLNTSEQFSVRLPAAGNYQVKVTGTALVSNSVPFHIAFNLDTLNTFMFRSPQHTSDIYRQKNPEFTIRWKTFVADTNQTGNLFISYDRGINWQLVKASHKIYTNHYQWLIKDTSSTGVFKMETSFGNFYSKEFIISPLTRPVIDFLCTDSLRFSWNKHVYANSYRIWALTDSPYLKPILVVNDSFVVIKRALYNYAVFAVEPITTNGIPAARSIAFDINFQAAHCFYRTLNYTLLDQNQIKLTLSLAITSYSDSVYFEKVSATGQLLEVYGGYRVMDNLFTYDHIINNVPSGVIYVRARIKLKTGEIVYTDIISILTSGEQPIVFYPNPVSRNSTLRYVFKQGMPFDIEIRLYDITGRMIRIVPLGAGINISGLAPGILIYKLYSESQGVLGSGKLVIQ